MCTADIFHIAEGKTFIKTAMAKSELSNYKSHLIFHMNKIRDTAIE